MPQIFQSSQRNQSNFQEAELLNRNFATEVATKRERLKKRAIRANRIKTAMQQNPDKFEAKGFTIDTQGNEDIALKQNRIKDDSILQGPDEKTIDSNVINDQQGALNTLNALGDQNWRNEVKGRNITIPNTNGGGNINSANVTQQQKNTALALLKKQTANKMGVVDNNVKGDKDALDSVNALNLLGNTMGSVADNQALEPTYDTNNLSQKQKDQVQKEHDEAALNIQQGILPGRNHRTSNSASSSQSKGENFMLSSGGSSLQTNSYVEKLTDSKDNINVLDTIKENEDDLYTDMLLGGTDFDGQVENNPAKIKYDAKMDVLKEIQTQRAKQVNESSRELQANAERYTSDTISNRQGVTAATSVNNSHTQNNSKSGSTKEPTLAELGVFGFNRNGKMTTFGDVDVVRNGTVVDKVGSKVKRKTFTMVTNSSMWGGKDKKTLANGQELITRAGMPSDPATGTVAESAADAYMNSLKQNLSGVAAGNLEYVVTDEGKIYRKDSSKPESKGNLLGTVEYQKAGKENGMSTWAPVIGWETGASLQDIENSDASGSAGKFKAGGTANWAGSTG